MNDSNNARRMDRTVERTMIDGTQRGLSSVAFGMALGLIAAATMLPARALAQYGGGDYSQQGAPIERQSADGGQPGYSNGEYDNAPLDEQQAEDVYQSDLTDAATNVPPPPLPMYEQPPAPDENYMWTPGYWAWSPMGYYWVPGCWVAVPYEGALWTPGYWDFYSEHYRFHHGYWSMHIGYYGGIDYGYGYVGRGYYGGYWNRGRFFYNTTITRVDVVRVHSVYVHPVVINNIVINQRITNRVSFNGGQGGVVARPLMSEVRVLHEQRLPPMAAQEQFRQAASQKRQQFYNVNRGRPMSVVSAQPVVRDRELPAALPSGGGSFAQPGGRGEVRPGQMQEGRPQSQYQRQPERNAPGSYQVGPGEQNRVGQQGRPSQQPQPEVRPNHPQPQSQSRYGQQPQQAQPQATPQSQPPVRFGQQPQSTPQSQGQGRFGQQPQSAPVVAHPQSQSQTAPVAARPQPQSAPPARPQPQIRPAPAAEQQAKPREDEKH